jgi:hypothetical protein
VRWGLCCTCTKVNAAAQQKHQNTALGVTLFQRGSKLFDYSLLHWVGFISAAIFLNLAPGLGAMMVGLGGRLAMEKQ